ncbi:MAG: hypothetical protein EOS76_33345 [Mesorhizobium sp.]|uniref:hypothetical protein n=1 Tax=unclassified Mesorhizobium TaxID=325217 RepID=UPI000F75CEDF|nr:MULTISPECIES: hypothetical protein [unclassified Mesorhizobium]RUY06707.1 hypothetical protein EOA25_16000 [Mesorhizobium sp. M2A.F.Ca.ET.040.01.1.1]AZO35683.1 hypothetical protein EJ072_15265 [Mesorhizobium sp. M2A.F.Ca.ET.046.03.2.1]RWB37020.1 MAG: hypothetical protein EOQ44_34500 [Mesorhizobium sp.]RWE04890.1 MAG: hypothetical protein EOS76_33345 [Mesorhizobium sp.]TIV38194.1 MAG: hypothetical protein E5V99_06510 [Mesorhizobium sp.]
MRIEFYGLHFDLPSDWADRTDNVPEGVPTLALPSGVGAFQFTIARYAGGKHPRVSIVALRSMLAEFCRKQPRAFDDPVTNMGKVFSVGCVSHDLSETLGVWYLSNGSDVVLATYLGLSFDHPEVASELAEVRQSIATMDF